MILNILPLWGRQFSQVIIYGCLLLQISIKKESMNLIASFFIYTQKF